MTAGSVPRAVPGRDRARLRAEWAAVATMFAVSGALFGNWFTRIPTAADLIGAGPGLLGGILLGAAVGAIASMPYVGRLCSRQGSVLMTPVAGVLTAGTLPLVGAAAHTGSPLALALSLVVFGAFSGGMDVAMNANAVAVVRRAQRALMPGLHAMFAVGGMIGAGMGSLASRLGLGILTHLSIAGILGILAVLLAGRFLAPDRPDATSSPEPAPAPAASAVAGAAPAIGAEPAAAAGRLREYLQRATGSVDGLLVLFGAVAWCCAVGEGAMADWTALFLRNVLHTSEAVGGIGYAAFAVSMAAGRFSGGWILRRWDPATVLIAGAALTVGGIALSVSVLAVPAAVVGFAAVGAGVGYGFPVALNAAGAHPLGAGPAIGLVTTVGYSGFLVGPPLIGGLAQLAGLRVGLTAVALIAAVGGVLAFRCRAALRQYDPSRSE
jgi:Major Facilitator Superfamily